MKCEWKYFIVLNDEDHFGSIVKAAEVPDYGIPICDDFDEAVSFKSLEELNDWVKKNTSLSLKTWDYHIERHYL